MVILKLTKPIPDEFECENVRPEDRKDGYSLVRPCERYKELYASCKSLRSRIYQYYVYGETLDCSPHYENYKSCMNYRQTKNPDFLDTIIKWEQDLIYTRLKTVEQNTTWRMRKSPPEDFDKPLPEFLAKRQRESAFEK